MIEAQGGNSQVLDRFELLPNATGVREITSPRAGYVSAIAAEDIGLASAMIGAGRNTKEDTIDPAVGVILEVKVGQKVEAGAVLCRLYYTSEEHVEKRPSKWKMPSAFPRTPPEERELILEVVAEADSVHGSLHRAAGNACDPGGRRALFSTHSAPSSPRVIALGPRPAARCSPLSCCARPRRGAFQAASDKVNNLIGYSRAGSTFVFGDQLGGEPAGVIFAFQVLPIIIFIAVCSPSFTISA